MVWYSYIYSYVWKFIYCNVIVHGNLKNTEPIKILLNPTKIQ